MCLAVIQYMPHFVGSLLLGPHLLVVSFAVVKMLARNCRSPIK